MEKYPLYLPQLGVNDVSAKIVEWTKKTYDNVKKGEIICIVETSKATFDVENQQDGFLNIVTEVGEEVALGDILAVITDVQSNTQEIKKWATELVLNSHELTPNDGTTSQEFTITEKARLLAHRSNVDINKISNKGKKITESDVLKYIEAQKSGEVSEDYKDTIDDLFSTNRVQRLAIIGAGDGAVQVLDALQKIPYQKAVILFDDKKNLHGKTVAGVPVAGSITEHAIEESFRKKEFDAAIISISTSIRFRKKIFEDLSSLGIPFANVIHPTVSVGMNVKIGTGNIILAMCHIGACCTIENNNFLSVFCNIEHHNRLGNHCSFGPGVVTSSKVHICDMVRCGTGIFIEPHLTIGEASILSSGCIIWKDIPARTIAKSNLNYVLRELTI